MIRAELLLLIVLSAALLLTNKAHAVTAPTTITTQGGSFYDDHLAACLALSSQYSGAPITTTSSGGFFQKVINGNSYSFKTGPDWKQCVYYTGTPVNGTYVGKYYFCQGSTYPDATNQCVTCPTGYTDQNGICSNTPAPCPAAGTIKSSGFYLLGPNPEASVPNIACDANCETTYSGAGVSKRAMVNGVYQYYFGQGGYNYTGQACSTGTPSPGTTTVPSNTCNPATQDTGQVNGVTVCIDKQQTDTSNTTKTPTTTNPDGSTSTTTTTTTNNTTNNTTTNTTITTTTAPDGTVTESKTETTSKNSPSTFCQQNPTDPTCLKNSKFCEDNPETLGCSTMGTVEDGIVGTKEFSIADITPKTIGGAGSCPAPITTSFMGRSITFTYDLPCQAASMLKPLILALSWLAAAIIFIGGVRQ